MLKYLSAEFAHNVGKWAMSKGLGGVKHYNPDFAVLNGFRLSNAVDCPLGLAAGFDKNGVTVEYIHKYGFGWVEVGSVTALGGKGNPKPRLFRVEGDGILNRMGLNGQPVEQVVENLKHIPSNRFAVNIAKTHSPEIMGDKAIDDIVYTYRRIGHRGLYTVLNISCPNTTEGKTFEDPAALRELVSEVSHIRTTVPLYLKVSPNLSAVQLEQIVEIHQHYKLDGFVACNTMPFTHPTNGKGGLSGPALLDESVNTVRSLRSMIPDTIIIGCGGINNGADVLRYEKAGANLFQAYSGFVRGPNAGRYFVRRLARQYREARAVDIHNFRNVLNAKLSESV